MASQLPNRATRQAVRLRNLTHCQSASILIEAEDVLTLTFEQPSGLNPAPPTSSPSTDTPPVPVNSTAVPERHGTGIPEDTSPVPGISTPNSLHPFMNAIQVPDGIASHSDTLLRCSECGRPGHWSYQCMGGAPAPDACFECGSPDHHYRACPIPAGLSQTPLSDSFFCRTHSRPRGYRNIMKDGFGGFRCKPDSECPQVGFTSTSALLAPHPPKRYRLSSCIRG